MLGVAREGGLGLLWDGEQSSGCCCGYVQATGSAPLELAALRNGEEEEGGGLGGVRGSGA